MDQRGLDWVKADVAEALEHAQIGLEEFAANPSDTSALERYVASVAQVGGVLAVLGLYGASLLARELEAAADSLAGAGANDPTDVQELLMQGVIKLRQYLQRIETGQADTAFVLLPFVNQIRAAQGRSALAEQDVFHPDLTPRRSPTPPARPAPQDLNAYVRKLRSFYQKALVEWLRGAETGLAQLDKVVSELVTRLGHTPWGQQWQVAGALVEALQDRGLSVNDSVKSLLRAADQELKRLSEEGASVLEEVASEQLMKGLLYHVGRANSKGVRTQYIKATYELDRWLPEQEKIARARANLAGPDAEAVSAVAGLLHEKLDQVKEWLDGYARKDPDSSQSLATTADTLHQLSSILATLGLRREQAVLEQRAVTLNDFSVQQLEPTEELLISLADELLAVESSIDVMAKQGVLHRTTEQGPPTGGEINHTAAQHGPPLGPVDEVRILMAREGQANLAKVKESMTAFVAQPTATQLLGEAPRLLGQVEGGLAMAGLVDASSIVQRFAVQLAAIVSEPSATDDAAVCDALAEIVVYLEDYLDAVVNDRESPHLLAAAASKLAALPGVGRPMPSADEGAIQQANELQPYPRREAADTATQRPEDVDEEIAEIFAEEAEEVLTTLSEHLPRWKARTGDQEALTVVRRSFHTLKGSGRLAGATAVGELSWALENMLNQVLEGTVTPTPAMLALLEGSIPALSALIAEFRGGAPAEIDLQSLIQQANALGQVKGAAVESSRQEERAPSEASPTPASRGRHDSSEGDVIATSPPEVAPQEQEREGGETNVPAGKADPVLRGLFLEEAGGHVAVLRRSIDACQHASEGVLAQEPVLRSLHTLRGNARVAGVQPVLAISQALEHACERLRESQTPAPAPLMTLFRDAIQRIEDILDALSKEREALPEVGELVSKIRDWSRQPLTAEAGHEPEAVAPAEVDNEDPEFAHTERHDQGVDSSLAPYDEALVGLFLEEASEILETTEALIEQWRANPTDQIAIRELQRQLHTLKGGARMANLIPMGDLSHEVETVLSALTDERISATDELVQRVQHTQDQLMQMLEQAHHRQAMVPADALIDELHCLVGTQGRGGREASETPVSEQNGPETDPGLPSGVAGETTTTPLDEKPTELKPTANLARAQETKVDRRQPDQVRVAFPLVERLANLAGEASISRSRLGQQIGAMHFNLGEMDQTVGRLREQLRRMEMETEAQVLFRYEQTVEGAQEDFDPLELDRYSQVQQLSRSLMESASDLSNIQELLDNVVSECETSLIQQARVTTELQEGLMQMRMVPFAGLVPRLKHLVRQTARELGKQVELKVTGASTELDRAVLNRISGPLEHMLRNAIDHGIERTEVRRERGKPEHGTIALAARYESAEVVLEISDDGAGLNLEQIRNTAKRRGLLEPDSALSDQELMQFILEPAFSTAPQISQVSGRGVGMDVVNTEIKQLNGTLEIDSVPKQSTTFTIRLPLTLSVTQALMVDAGEEQFAIPINSLEGVTRMPQEALARLYHAERPELAYQETTYRLCHLGQLLGCGQPDLSTPSKSLPVLLVRSGPHRTAFQVDGLNLSQEVVVKSAGPLLASIPWLAGATILADGSVVLILDMPALVRMSEASGQAVEALRQGPGASQAAARDRVPTVLVVDDSITVRKVTSRLLESHGMRVLTAKDGVDAVSLLQEQLPDMMLLDVEMPRMDGYELATQVRNDDRLKHLPIIMITSRTATKHRERARKIGVDQYLGKPYGEQELLGGIRDALGLRP